MTCSSPASMREKSSARRGAALDGYLRQNSFISGGVTESYALLRLIMCQLKLSSSHFYNSKGTFSSRKTLLL